jgi:glycosyltransferase involved in cell wall biosynthesis
MENQTIARRQPGALTTGFRNSGSFMRILFYTHYFPPEGNAPASRVFEMSKAWVAAGHRVTVITCAPNVPNGVVYDGYRNHFRKLETIEGIDVVRVWTFIAPNKGAVRRLLNYASYMVSALFQTLFVERPDVIIATSPQLFCGWAGQLAHWFLRRPFVLEVRDMWAEGITTLTSVEQGRLLGILESIENKLYRMAPRIVTVGEGYRKRLVEKGVDPAKMTIVTNGVDTEFFAPRPPDAELRSEWGLEGKFVCAYVGTIGLACSLDVAVDAGKFLKQQGRDDIVFLIVGDGAVREELAAKVRENGLEKIVVMTGRLPKEEIPRVHALSDCALVHLRKSPLFASVLPSKIFEISHMKKPIILGVAGEAARLVEASGGGICIEPDNAAELLEAVARLKDDPELAARMGQSGHDYVAKNFDRQKLAQVYLEYLEQVVAGC